MGQERSGKGKHLFLCITCCISVSLWLCGCAHSLKQWQGEQDLKEAKHLMSTGDYSASEMKTLVVLEEFPQMFGDEALFQMGLIYSLPKNPNADYEKSTTFFQKLVALYPDSSRKEEASAWLLLLTTRAAYEKETLELQERVRVIEQTSEATEKKLKQLQENLETKQKGITGHRKTVSQMQEELEAREKESAEYQDAVSRLQGRVTELESQLAKFKNIDLTIEQKKRVTTP